VFYVEIEAPGFVPGGRYPVLWVQEQGGTLRLWVADDQGRITSVPAEACRLAEIPPPRQCLTCGHQERGYCRVLQKKVRPSGSCPDWCPRPEC